MAFTRDWLEANPIDHTKFSAQPGHVRAHKVDISDRLKAIIEGFTSGETAVGFKTLQLLHQSSDPSVAAQQLQLYGKDLLIGGNTDVELYSNHETGGVQQLTYIGKLWLSALDIASAAQGDIIYRNGSIFTRLGAGTDGQFLITQGAAANPAWSNRLRFGTPSELTIATGAITVTSTFHLVDTESDAASDDLDTISGGVTGDIIYLQAANTGRTVVYKHGTGNLKCSSGVDQSASSTDQIAKFLFDGTDWQMLNFASNIS